MPEKKPLSANQLAYHQRRKEAARKDRADGLPEIFEIEKVDDGVSFYDSPEEPPVLEPPVETRCLDDVEIAESVEITEQPLIDHFYRHYPQEIMLSCEESFIDQDGIKFRYPAHKVIRNPVSIRVLIDRHAHYTDLADLDQKK